MRVFYWFVLFGIFFSCTNSKQKAIPIETNVSETGSTLFVIPKPIIITYHKTVYNNSTWDSIKKIYSIEHLQLIAGLNRIDLNCLHHADSLVIPDTILSNWMFYSPYPDSLPFISDIHKILLFSDQIQAFAAYDNGKLVNWGPISTGKQSSPTPRGLFYSNWKAVTTKSTVDSSWILNWYFNLDNKEGVSWHEYILPGFPASHSCIRLRHDDAKWLYYWAEQWILADAYTIAAYGTPAIVFGNYDFNGRKPWMSLYENSKATTFSIDSLQKEIMQFHTAIKEMQLKWDSLMSLNISGN